MKTLVLCVDRDDDMGAKAGVETPVVGRRRCVEAAMALGLADPEDSDTNALLAAVRVYDQELREAETGGNQAEVACIAGGRSLGLKGDRKLAHELDEVLALVRPDDVVLVSDGAEDEQILPILQSRVKVSHVHRSVVKQAPRLEGFYYVLTRMLDEPKQARRFVLPTAIILLVWGAAILFGFQTYAWGATLAFAGLWLLVHAMKWEDRVGGVLRDLGLSLRTGKVSIFATILMVVLLAVGALQAWEETPPADQATTTFRTLVFLEAYLPYFVSGLLVRTVGRLLDTWIRQGGAGLGHWTAGSFFIAFGFLADVALEVAIGYLEHDTWADILTFGLVVQLMAGLALAMGAFIVARYLRNFFKPTTT
ncbi:MAG TPA: DUF373 family protein [Candidatus Thermoplasmatota archaeon]|nr:DUF373 family protein [Candidatus Thermoplasmatota archaeon]